MQPENSGRRLDLELNFTIDEAFSSRCEPIGARAVNERCRRRGRNLRNGLEPLQYFFPDLAGGLAGKRHAAMSAL
jgi:hypothetical protein